MSTHIEPGTIVVGVDGSEHAERAVAWAAEQAALEHRPLVVVAAADVSRAAGWPGTAGWPAPSIAEELRLGAGEVATEAAATAQRLHPGLAVRHVTALGDPRHELIDLSRHAHLIVLGSRGRGTVRSMLLGSVSAAVSKHAECPVAICRPPRHRPATGGVVVGADGTVESVPVIEFAFEQASLRNLPLTVVHCSWDVVAAVAGMRTASAEPLSQDVAELRAVLSESVAGLTGKFPDVPVTLVVRHGLADDVIVGHKAAWDLVVVGRHPLDSLGRMVTGSIATAVLERSHCTVVVVPEAAASEEDPD